MHAVESRSDRLVSFDRATFGGADSFIIQFTGSSHLTKLICIQSKRFHVGAASGISKSARQIDVICSPFCRSSQPPAFLPGPRAADSSPVDQLTRFNHQTANISASNKSIPPRSEQQLLG